MRSCFYFLRSGFYYVPGSLGGAGHQKCSISKHPVRSARFSMLRRKNEATLEASKNSEFRGSHGGASLEANKRFLIAVGKAKQSKRASATRTKQYVFPPGSFSSERGCRRTTSPTAYLPRIQDERLHNFLSSFLPHDPRPCFGGGDGGGGGTGGGGGGGDGGTAEDTSARRQRRTSQRGNPPTACVNGGGWRCLSHPHRRHPGSSRVYN